MLAASPRRRLTKLAKSIGATVIARAEWAGCSVYRLLRRWWRARRLHGLDKTPGAAFCDPPVDTESRNVKQAHHRGGRPTNIRDTWWPDTNESIIVLGRLDIWEHGHVAAQDRLGDDEGKNGDGHESECLRIERPGHERPLRWRGKWRKARESRARARRGHAVYEHPDNVASTQLVTQSLDSWPISLWSVTVVDTNGLFPCLVGLFGCRLRGMASEYRCCYSTADRRGSPVPAGRADG